ncbi:MAG TPA: hypothetical protein PLQ30_01880, partial [Rectinema sp.]|nr:hypothetical protein [Rectinema sp.]
MKGEGKEKGIRFLLQPIAALLIINIYIIMTSCGLPTTDYLYTPKDFSSEGGALVLEHDTKNIDELSSIFLGYEIYYRIFDDEVAAGDSRNSISSMKSSNIIQTANNYKYFPLKHRKKSESGQFSLDISPLIKVSSNTYTKYYLNMKPQETWTLTYEDSEIVIDSIVRNRSDTASSAEIADADFCLSSGYQVNDRDYAGSSSSPDIVYIVFFAFAYGFDTSTMRNVYSDPFIL